MNLLSGSLENNMRRTSEALLIFVVTLFGLVCMGSARAQIVSRFAYVSGANGISIYTVNPKTGQLRTNGYVFPGAGLSGATIDPSGRFVYAIGPEPNSISAYTINASTGELTAIPGSYASPAGSGPVSITVDLSDKFLYVINDDASKISGSISAYTIDGDNGTLTLVHGSPFATGQAPASVAIDPSGKFAYVNNEDDSPGGDISGYTIDATTGALTTMAGSPFLSHSGAFSIAIAPSGEFGYVGFGDGAQVTPFTINPTTGVPTAVPGSPFIGPGDGSYAIVVSPSSKVVYAVGANNISAFLVNATTGKLTSVKGSPFAAGNNAYYATMDPAGTRLYVRNVGSNDVWTYKVASNGPLTLLNEVRTPPGFGPVALVTGSAAVNYTPTFAYVANQGSNTVASSISAYSIVAKNGHIAAVSGSPFPDGAAGIYAFANSVTVDPLGRFAYVANLNTSNVAAYKINSSTGALTAVSGSPFAAGTSPISVTADPSGRFVYVANQGSLNISAFAIDASTGALSPLGDSPVPTGTTDAAPVSVTVDPTGQFVYVANSSIVNGSISAFTIDPGTGELTAVAHSPFADGYNPVSVAVEASGRFALVTNGDAVPDSGGQYEMSSFAINATTGALTPGNYSRNLGAGTFALTTDPLGQFLYTTQDAVGDFLSLSFNSTTDEYSLPIESPNTCIPDTEPASLTVDPSGKFLYVANSGANDITACAIDQTTGDLSNVSGERQVTAGPSPVSVVTTGTIH
jgi:6-phosphogluconolactonase (cycloisomerase 2 family)